MAEGDLKYIIRNGQRISITEDANGYYTETVIIASGGTKDHSLEVARGAVAGYTSVNKFGEAPAGVQTSATDIWDRADAAPTQSIWTAPTQARIHALVSTSASDDGSPVGAGARTIRLWGLTGWGATEVSEDITLNGTGSVNSASAYVIIHRMRTITTGSLGGNAGTISATAASDATVTAAIRANEGTTHMAIYGVPSTQKAYLKRWYGSINKASGAAATINFRLMFNPEPDVELKHFSVRSERGVQSTGTSDVDWHLDVPVELPGPAIIKIQGIASTSDIDGSAGFDLILVDS